MVGFFDRYGTLSSSPGRMVGWCLRKMSFESEGINFRSYRLLLYMIQQIVANNRQAQATATVGTTMASKMLASDTESPTFSNVGNRVVTMGPGEGSGAHGPTMAALLVTIYGATCIL